MHRRTFLGGLALLGSTAIAGCSVYERTTLKFHAVDPPKLGVAATAEDLPPGAPEEISRAAARGETVPRSDLPEFVLMDGTYYRIDPHQFSVTINDTRHIVDNHFAEWPVLVVEPVEDTPDAVPLDRYGGRIVETVAGVADGNATRRHLLDPELAVDGALVPSPRHRNVTRDGRTYRLRIETHQVEPADGHSRPVPVATSPEGFAEVLHEETGAALFPGDFTDAERAIVENAIDGGYAERDSALLELRDTYSKAFRTVRDRVRAQGTAVKPVVELHAAEVYVVVYDDRLYLASIMSMVREP